MVEVFSEDGCRPDPDEDSWWIYCPECILKGRCPRCGERTYEVYLQVRIRAPCSACGWSWGDSSEEDLLPD